MTILPQSPLQPLNPRSILPSNQISQLVSAKNLHLGKLNYRPPFPPFWEKCFCFTCALLEITTPSVWTFILSLLYITCTYNWDRFFVSSFSSGSWLLPFLSYDFFLFLIFIYVLPLPTVSPPFEVRGEHQRMLLVTGTDRGKPFVRTGRCVGIWLPLWCSSGSYFLPWL